MAFENHSQSKVGPRTSRGTSCPSRFASERNPAIVVGGTKDEMVLRLEGLLRTGKLYLLVRRMIGVKD